MESKSTASSVDESTKGRVHVVEFSEFRELLVCRRRLERVGTRDCLRDVDSDEIFVLAPSDHRLAQCV